MDMWNWLYENYEEGNLTLTEIKQVLKSEDKAFELWKDFCDNRDFISTVQEQVEDFYRYIKAKHGGEL